MIESTIRLDQARDPLWDALVVGAGPAGALASRELARSGLRVLLVDRAHFPREKVCGACLGPAAVDALCGAGLGALLDELGAPTLGAISLRFGERRVRLPLRGGRVLSRRALDAALVREAIAAGAEFLGGVRAELDRSADENRTVALHDRESVACARARFVIAADGLSSDLLRSAGVPERAARSSRIGVGAIAPPAEPAVQGVVRTVTMVVDRAGYIGFTPLEDGSLDLAAALDPEAVRAAGGPGALVARAFDRARIRGVSPEALEWRGTPVLTRRPRRPYAERILAIGDAAGYVEPFTGEGIGWALVGARSVAPIVVRALERGDPESAGPAWMRARRRALFSRQLTCRAVALLLRHRRLARAVAVLLERAPWFTEPVVRLGYGRPEGTR